MQEDYSYWDIEIPELLSRLEVTDSGLTGAEAEERLRQAGLNTLRAHKTKSLLKLLLSQFTTPFILILQVAAIASFAFGDETNGIIITLILLVSGLLGFFQEKGAQDAVGKLLSIVQIKARVWRDESYQKIPVEELVPGDIVFLEAGDVIPADLRILEEKDLFINEASLTGETFGVEKNLGVVPQETPLSGRFNCLFMGSHVISGTAKAIVVRTGKHTLFGAISARLSVKPPETSFEKGIRSFSILLMQVTSVLVVSIFIFNILFHRPFLESFMFSLALAIGLTPQLLPAIISVSLAYGAKQMAKNNVIVKRLSSIQNFGSMDVLCTDKTGTLTRGVVELYSALDMEGNEGEKCGLYAFINSSFMLGLENPIDNAIKRRNIFDISSWNKLDEIPFDFMRRRTSILAKQEGASTIITKGAFSEILSICSAVEMPSGELIDIEMLRPQIDESIKNWSEQGFRVLALAHKKVGAKLLINTKDETEMTLLGLLLFYDPPKPSASSSVAELMRLGISLKVITGDNHYVAKYIAEKIGLKDLELVTGKELSEMSDEALSVRVGAINIFAEVEPQHKDRIIRALKKNGSTVGFLGDGVNDVTALHEADVGISVDTAVDVAKEVADIVLLETDLSVLVEGVRAGRRTFANTMKYILMATSANFGNMFSMVGASVFLNFLPLLPKQILLTNLLTDLSEMPIASDSIDQEMADKPWKWDIKFIRKFMMVFGLVSSIFDYCTFGVLIFVLHASKEQFRTGWFLESVISASLIILFIRTRKSAFKSRPSIYLIGAVAGVIALTLYIPYSPFAHLFELTPLPAIFFGYIGAILLLYIAAIEMAKLLFFKKYKQ